MTPFDLVEPRTLEEALQHLDHGDPSIRPLGGGTALMLMMKAQLFQPVRLVSLRHMDGIFRTLSVDGDVLRIGAMTTFSELNRSLEVAKHFPVVIRAMPALANRRVRNVATVGGNLAHADPHLDLPPIWMALDAEVLIVGRQGQRQCRVADLFTGYYETVLEDGELIAELQVPLRPTWRTTYVKVTTRALHDWPALGLAVSLELRGDHINDARVVLSGALDKATRLTDVEAVLGNKDIDDDLIRLAGDVASAEADLESDNRGSADYKSHLLRIHLARAIHFLRQDKHES